MADSLQAAFQRIHISEDDLKTGSGSSSANDDVKIPIIKKSLDAASCSKELSDISPVCVLVVGMAGSGKTTLMSALQRSLAVPDEDEDEDEDGDNKQETDGGGADADATGKSEDSVESNGQPVGYCVNLDPATKLVPFGASIDIRDTVDYKEVMKQHRLG